MSSLSVPMMPSSNSPIRREHLGPLAIFLKAHGYGWVEETLKHVVKSEGDLSGLVRAELIDAEDLEGAELAMESGFDGLPYYSKGWDESRAWNPTATLSVTPPELEDGGDLESDGTPDESVTHQPGYREALERDGITLMPVSGGAPIEPYEPTPEDWEEYRRFSAMEEAKDRARAIAEARNPMYGYE